MAELKYWFNRCIFESMLEYRRYQAENAIAIIYDSSIEERGREARSLVS